MKYKCNICGYTYDEKKLSEKFNDLKLAWKCPDCGVPKTYFQEETKSGKLKKERNVKGQQYSQESIYIEVNDDSCSIERQSDLCVQCGQCKDICKKQQGVCGYFDSNRITQKSICIDCGQCTLVCPTGAIRLKSEIENVKIALNNKNKIVVFQIAPSVRVAIGEEFCLDYGVNCDGKLVSALKILGAKYVFDTTFGADLTIMEEASELVERTRKSVTLPMFTSCCPAWVKFAEVFYPEILPHLSSTKSPILMQGAVIKTYFAKKMNIDPSKIVMVAVTPCTAKKTEIRREEMDASAKYMKNDTFRDVDYVLTVRELSELLHEKKIDLGEVEESNFDSPLGRASGGGLIFGNSGGVMESALRTAHYMLTGKNVDNIEFKDVRGLKGIKTASAKIGDETLTVAIVAGTGNVRKLLDRIKKGERFDFVEVMACPGGCVTGGGQPKLGAEERKQVYKKRANGLYKLDKTSKTRFAHENDEIKSLYFEFLGSPLSKLSYQLLHTSYIDKSGLLGK